jgi:hypothetical protein
VRERIVDPRSALAGVGVSIRLGHRTRRCPKPPQDVEMMLDYARHRGPTFPPGRAHTSLRRVSRGIDRRLAPQAAPCGA